MSFAKSLSLLVDRSLGRFFRFTLKKTRMQMIKIMAEPLEALTMIHILDELLPGGGGTIVVVTGGRAEWGGGGDGRGTATALKKRYVSNLDRQLGDNTTPPTLPTGNLPIIFTRQSPHC